MNINDRKRDYIHSSEPQYFRDMPDAVLLRHAKNLFQKGPEGTSHQHHLPSRTRETKPPGTTHHSPMDTPPPSFPLAPPPEPTLFPTREVLFFEPLFAPSFAAAEKEVLAKVDILQFNQYFDKWRACVNCHYCTGFRSYLSTDNNELAREPCNCPSCDGFSPSFSLSEIRTT